MAGVAAVEQSIVQAFTAKVVADVIANSQVEFLGDGLDASVLRELETVRARSARGWHRLTSARGRQRWKSKLSAMVNQVDKEPASGATRAARIVAPAAVPVAKVRLRNLRVLRRVSELPTGAGAGEAGSRVEAGSSATIASCRVRLPSIAVLPSPRSPFTHGRAAMEPLALLGRPLPQLPLSGWIVDAPQTEPEPAAPPQARA